MREQIYLNSQVVSNKDTSSSQHVNEKGLMAIAGISESELAWSNIYSYFMDARNEPAYASAFINALLALCNLEYSEIFPDGNYCVKTEVSTTNKSENNSIPRIDILIEGAKSIIIENKINHVLNNPLNEYWDYAIRPAVLIVLTIGRISKYEIETYCSSWNKRRSEKDKIKCINLTHYDLITRAKEFYGKDFDNPILKELKNIIIKKTIIMPDNLYIKNDYERITANKIYEQETRRREMIVRECMAIKAFDESGLPLISFKSCPNNNWLHFRYQGQDDLIIGVMCAYLWDWERYENDRLRRLKKNEANLQSPPVITLFVQVHGELYREMKRKNELIIQCNGYDISGKFCHIMDYDIDMTDACEKFCRKGELASFLTGILQDKDKCKILATADKIYKDYISISI